MSSSNTHDTVAVSYNAGFIILSWIVSLTGCATTLELLHRRTSNFGLYNWYLLATSAISMGGVGIWCMHFIGNRAIVLTFEGFNGSISYNSNYTAASFFLPIVVLMAAFYFVGLTDQANIWLLLLAGTLTGAAVCGMHYVGEMGIANFYCTYLVAHVVGAALIALLASNIALYVFFRMRASWTNSWWKRIMCASTLALAVSGMHWTAATGTSYRAKARMMSSQLSPTVTVVVCTILSVSSCVILMTIAIVSTKRQSRSVVRARQLVLACAFFDPSGRVMVSTDGFLPSQKITNHYLERTFSEDEFNKTHPAFIWAFRASRNWTELGRLIPNMREHLASNPVIEKYRSPDGHPMTTEPNTAENQDFSHIFKQLFCVAADELADQVNQPLDKLGVLFEDVMATGTHVVPGRQPRNTISDINIELADTLDRKDSEMSYTFGRGQFMFSVRQLSKQDAASLAASGYRFATISHIAPPLSRSMQVPNEDIITRLNQMQRSAQGVQLMDPGIYFGCFSLYPTVRKAFNVLVQREAPNLLPCVPLPFTDLTHWELDLLSQMDGMTIADCLKWLYARSGQKSPLGMLCAQVHKVALELLNTLGDPFFDQARFSKQYVKVPCRSTDPDAEGPAGECIVFSFSMIMTLHSVPASASLMLSPLRFFKAQQEIYDGSASQQNFIHEFYRDFSQRPGSPDVSSMTPPTAKSSNTLKSRVRGFWKRPHSQSAEIGDQSLVENPAFSGIMVSTGLSIDVSAYQKDDSQVSVNSRELGLSTEAAYHSSRGETFVDDLYALCRPRGDQAAVI